MKCSGKLALVLIALLSKPWSPQFAVDPVHRSAYHVQSIVTSVDVLHVSPVCNVVLYHVVLRQSTRYFGIKANATFQAIGMNSAWLTCHGLNQSPLPTHAKIASFG